MDGYEIMYPGDPDAEPEMIYNCRCTLVPKLKSLDQSDAPRDNRLGDMSYDEWKNEHKKGDVNGDFAKDTQKTTSDENL